ncbi:hypothetical protein FHS29_005294 [Saccharothrix tamanrassetensis]|uniref:Uncharacterized protein n=1 Tax=Saccharothrix tamanrassetensis TaxID=1051531 RepID=A0A841CRT6_9PSEU|nr:hypothetical protein [Saccharothrix tamanrassetensis]MBB5958685.1 hypothetical protein [Saccharothrix tamanrassetensis]
MSSPSPQHPTPYLPLAALGLAVSVAVMDGDSLLWLRIALLVFAAVVLVVWAVGYRRRRLH